MKYIAIAGRQPEISLAEIEAVFGGGRIKDRNIIEFDTNSEPEIDRLGGSLKLAVRLSASPLRYLSNVPDVKITLGNFQKKK